MINGKKIYWDEFIPFAHGVRLFGQFYNDIKSPEDPYEFVDLLTSDKIESVKRNRRIEEIAMKCKKHKFKDLEKEAELMLKESPDIAGVGADQERTDKMKQLIISISGKGNIKHKNESGKKSKLEKEFLNIFPENEKKDC